MLQTVFSKKNKQKNKTGKEVREGEWKREKESLPLQVTEDGRLEVNIHLHCTL